MLALNNQRKMILKVTYFFLQNIAFNCNGIFKFVAKSYICITTVAELLYKL